jgi:uncharacterized membrane protein
MIRWLLVSFLLTLLSLVGPLLLYFLFPDLLKDPIPTHTNVAGEVDQWTPRERILPQWLILPGIMAALSAGFVLMPWLSPKGFEIDRFRETFYFLMALMILMMAYIQLLFVLGGIQNIQLNMSRWLLGGLSLFFSLLGNRLGKVQRNFWMGVRTPWTLASEAVWIQTHRLTAWLWTAGGVILAGVAFANLSVWVWLTGMLLMVFSPVIYSLWLYKRLEKQGKFTPPSSVPEDVP